MDRGSAQLLRFSCVLTVIGLALCVWSLVDPHPIPVILAMSAAQAIGSLAFLLYLVVVVRDLRRARVLRRRADP